MRSGPCSPPTARPPCAWTSTIRTPPTAPTSSNMTAAPSATAPSSGWSSWRTEERRHPAPHPGGEAARARHQGRLEANLDLVAAVLRLLGRRVVRRDQRLIRAAAAGDDLVLRDAARHPL